MDEKAACLETRDLDVLGVSRRGVTLADFLVSYVATHTDLAGM